MTELLKGERTRIHSFHPLSSDRICRLLALGLRPGREVVLLGSFPGFLLQVGCQRIALDRELAAKIRVAAPCEQRKE